MLGMHLYGLQEENRHMADIFIQVTPTILCVCVCVELTGFLTEYYENS